LLIYRAKQGTVETVADLVRSVEQQLKPNPDLPQLRPGDTVRVHFRIVEGDRERTQVFQGTVMRLRKGGANANFTVRRIASHGVGVERTFFLSSPRLEKVEVLRHAHVRKAQLYYLRGRKGKAARLREKR
jgi:large subunit ribosomal protein L19